jgi:hypothetical protein
MHGQQNIKKQTTNVQAIHPSVVRTEKRDSPPLNFREINISSFYSKWQHIKSLLKPDRNINTLRENLHIS